MQVCIYSAPYALVDLGSIGDNQLSTSISLGTQTSTFM